LNDLVNKTLKRRNDFQDKRNWLALLLKEGWEVYQSLRRYNAELSSSTLRKPSPTYEAKAIPEI